MMTTQIEYALMAGASYISTRADVNQFPVPNGWLAKLDKRQALPSGFEATYFTMGTEIVISYAGTYDKDLTGDWVANVGLANGGGSVQLLQAAEYYLQVKAQNSGAVITLTGHSLGGGLAALVGVFFGESASTFDQAPFRKSAFIYTSADANGNPVTRSVAQDLKAYLAGRVAPELLAPLDRYIAANDPTNPNPIAADTLAVREARVSTIRVDGEFTSAAPLSSFNPIGTPATVLTHGPYSSPSIDMHSQALLATFLQSNQFAPLDPVTQQRQSLSEVTKKLTDLLGMIFDKKLYSFETDDPNNKNFLELLVQHQAGIRDPVIGVVSLAADAMVTRFTADLWKLAQEGGLTLRDGNTGNPDLNEVSKALMAFAMQKYYEERLGDPGAGQELFAKITGGIRFDLASVSRKLAAAFAAGAKANLAEVKGNGTYLRFYA